MTGPMQKMYGAATLVGKDEMNGRINPALEPDEDLPIIEAQRKKSIQRATKNPFRGEVSEADQGSSSFGGGLIGGGGQKQAGAQGNTAF